MLIDSTTSSMILLIVTVNLNACPLPLDYSIFVVRSRFVKGKKGDKKKSNVDGWLIHPVKILVSFFLLRYLGLHHLISHMKLITYVLVGRSIELVV